MSTTTEIVALQQDIDRAISSSRRRNLLTTLLALVSIAGIGYWLYYAHTKFAAVDPDFAVTYAQGKLTDYLPQASTDLESSLKSYAPKFVGSAEERLRAVPDRFADELENRTKAELDKAAPQLEDELYKSLKTSLDQAKTNAKGADDSARFKSLLDALADTYRDESIKLVDDVHNTYMKNGSDIVAYIQVLGQNKNLDRRQQLHHDMIQQFLLVAHDQGTPQVLPVAK